MSGMGWLPRCGVWLALAVALFLPLSPFCSRAMARPWYCEQCHGSNPDPAYPSRLLMTDPNPGVESQRSWQLTDGEPKGEWVERGVHPIDDILTKSMGTGEKTCRLCHFPTCDSCHKKYAENYELGPYAGRLNALQVLEWYGQVHAPSSETVTYPYDPYGFSFPEDNPTAPTQQSCASACHAWVMGECPPDAGGVGSWLRDGKCHKDWQDGEVSEPGFGDASYAGTISPAALLSSPSNAHAQVYASTGCAGLCHGGPEPVPAGMIENCEWGTGEECQGTPWALHGTITNCKSCHDFDVLGVTDGNPDHARLHLLHISRLTLERPLADTAGFQAQPSSLVCDYCHSSKASCWNCHLSGHNPITQYWQGIPEVPAVQ